MILAVDVGLRSGFAHYAADGRVTHFGAAQYTNTSQFRARSRDVLLEARPGAVTKTHLVLEGPPDLLRAWEDVVEELDEEPALVWQVGPGEWREELLLPRERASGHKAKAAARLIARQIIRRFGLGVESPVSMNTDAAEAVLIGYYACLKLGWLPATKTPIERFTNGNVVL